jgi:hypothetical protein
VRVPLTLTRPWTGEFTATGALGRHAEAIAILTAGQLALLVENQRLREAHHDRRGCLLFLAEAGEMLGRSMGVDLMVALIPRLVVPRLAQWCAVHSPAVRRARIAAIATPTMGHRRLRHLDGAGAAQRVMAGGGLARWAHNDPSFPLTVRRAAQRACRRPAGANHTPDGPACGDLARARQSPSTTPCA